MSLHAKTMQEFQNFHYSLELQLVRNKKQRINNRACDRFRQKLDNLFDFTA
jgi:uncharacterized protein YggL (DUF469 family)